MALLLASPQGWRLHFTSPSFSSSFRKIVSSPVLYTILSAMELTSLQGEAYTKDIRFYILVVI